MDTVFLIGRILLGVYFMTAGLMHFANEKDMTAYVASKKLPWPRVGVWVSGAVLAAGGLGVLTQQLLPWAYGALIVFLLAAAFLMHNFWKAQDAHGAMVDMTHFQKNIALAAALAMLLALTA